MSQSQEPQVVADYFRIRADRTDPDWYLTYTDREHATITQVFYPDRGWRRYPGVKRISGSWARKMRGDGIAAVALTSAGRTADFTIQELTR